MRITVLGKSPAWQDADGACSGYLVEEAGFCVLVDCGNGVFGKLRAQRDYTTVDALVISHLHADHMFDLIPYAYALCYSPHPCEHAGRRPVLHAPPGARAAFGRITDELHAPGLIENAFDVREYDASVELELGPLRARFREVPHFVRTHAIQVADGERTFTFGADCAPNDALVEFGRDTDLMMLEATLSRPETQVPRGHLTAEEAGELGRRAGARRLVLTHFSSDIGPEHVRSDGEGAFGAPVEVAHEGATYTV